VALGILVPFERVGGQFEELLPLLYGKGTGRTAGLRRSHSKFGGRWGALLELLFGWVFFKQFAYRFFHLVERLLFVLVVQVYFHLATPE
jgi:hypothetical protein